jgi:hypothetical protein
VMRFPPNVSLIDSEARHSEAWYDETLSTNPLQAGDRLFIRCDGGPCLSRLETFPPRLEIRERTGLYVLVDDGSVDAWTCQFVTHATGTPGRKPAGRESA